MDNFDTDELARVVADANGLPVEALRDPRDVAKIRAQRAQQQNIAAAAELAPGAAGAVKDLAIAAATSQGARGQQGSSKAAA